MRIFIFFLFLFSCAPSEDGGGRITNSPTNNTNNGSNQDDVPGADPLAPYQWYLINSGDNILGYRGFAQDADIDWSAGFSYKGNGQYVIVSDGRLEIEHEDLFSNTSSSLSRNFSTSSGGDGEDPNTGSDIDNHGTFIMGLIGAVENNSKGIIGVAPEVTLIGYNYLDSAQTTSQTLLNYESSVTGIFNYSYGFFNCEVTTTMPGEIAKLKSESSAGNIFVTAAGNDFYESQDYCGGDAEISYLGNSNFNQFKVPPEMIVVAGVNGESLTTIYTTPGANILISAPGGDSRSPMLSLDLSGCNKGLSNSSVDSSFDRGENDLNSDCNYVIGGMMGTSFATPVVTGAVAIIKEMCPSCDWRDVRYILAKTATYDSSIEWSYDHPLGLDLASYKYHEGFITNAAGLSFNNDLGFGVLNVNDIIDFINLSGGGVELNDKRESLNIDGSHFYQSGSINLSIPDNNSTGVTSSISVDSHNLSIEHVEVEVTLDHQYLSDVGMDLISPSGTSMRLLYINSEILMEGEHTFKLGVNGFMGELSQGSWQLKVVDGYPNDTGTLKSWSLSFMGSKWNNTSSGSPSAPSGLSNTGNTISWSDANSDTLRFEICIKESGGTCSENDWIPIDHSSSNYTVTKYRNGYWRSIQSSTDYTFYIRSISPNEDESSTSSLTWSAP